MNDDEVNRWIINRDKLPPLFPTHGHSPHFWEQLGRTIATYGFLEEILGKAIFAFTATRNYSLDEIDAAYQAWLPQLEHVGASCRPPQPLSEESEEHVRSAGPGSSNRRPGVAGSRSSAGTQGHARSAAGSPCTAALQIGQ
jgi:hypothetical protein